jgi:AraC-like DNA-binding protein
MRQECIKYFFSKSDCAELVYSKNSRLSFAEHNHTSSYTIGIIINGVIQLNINGRIKSYEKYEYYIIAPYEPHSVSSDGKEYTMISVCINKDYIIECSRDYILKLILELICYINEEETVKNKLSDIIQNAADNLLSKPHYVESNKSLNTARDILEQRYWDKIDVSELAGSVYISKYHFIREFKKYAGLTPHNFQVQRRIRQAQRMLRHNYGITETALAAGFCDQSHFIKCFRKIVGLTPSEYISAQRNP